MSGQNRRRGGRMMRSILFGAPTIVALLALTANASAQRRDPYAESDRQQILADYYADRAKAIDNIKFVYFAKGCKVITYGADNLRNYFLRSLIEGPYYRQATSEMDHIVALWKTAEQEGRTQSPVPNACDWFKENPTVVRSLRDAEQRGVY
jgi:hypothetical protein